MGGESVYLDTSAIVKRYVAEEGSEQVDGIYDGAYAGRARIGFSVWNVGEVAVVLDKYERRGVIGDAKRVFELFLGETRLLARLNQLRLVPLSFKVIATAVSYVFKRGIYVADAVQLASARDFDAFLTYDERLARVARAERLSVVGVRP